MLTASDTDKEQPTFLHYQGMEQIKYNRISAQTGIETNKR
jgi:hypothetical protein